MSAEGTNRARVRKLLLAGITVLYGISIPWYRSDDTEFKLLLGLPDWVGIALGCYVGIAVLNAVAWLLTEIPEAMPPKDPTLP